MNVKETVTLGNKTYEVTNNMVMIGGELTPYRSEKNGLHYHLALLPDGTPYCEIDGMEELQAEEAKMNEEMPPQRYSLLLLDYLKDYQTKKYNKQLIAGELSALRYTVDKDCSERYFQIKEKMMADAKDELTPNNWEKYIQQTAQISRIAEELTLQHMWETYAPETQTIG